MASRLDPKVRSAGLDLELVLETGRAQRPGPAAGTFVKIDPQAVIDEQSAGDFRRDLDASARDGLVQRWALYRSRTLHEGGLSGMFTMDRKKLSFTHTQSCWCVMRDPWIFGGMTQ